MTTVDTLRDRQHGVADRVLAEMADIVAAHTGGRNRQYANSQLSGALYMAHALGLITDTEWSEWEARSRGA